MTNRRIQNFEYVEIILLMYLARLAESVENNIYSNSTIFIERTRQVVPVKTERSD
jgi:hypothetical protein